MTHRMLFGALGAALTTLPLLALAQQPGAVSFGEHCASCHGERGQGGSNIPALTTPQTQQQSDAALFDLITNGTRNGMPSWSQLPEAERHQLVAFVRALPGGAVAVMPAETPAAALDAPPPTPPFTDFRYESPGTIRKLTVADLPKPYATDSAGNGPKVVPRPEGAWPKALPGFKVELYAEGLTNPRLTRTAPNGDVFVSETSAGRIRVFRGITAQGKPEKSEVFAEGLTKPFGIAFYPAEAPKWVYVATIDRVMRFPYQAGDMKARAKPEVLTDIPGGTGHTSRDVQFSKDGKTMFIAVGSRSNVDDPDTTPEEADRADILQFTPEGGHQKVYAYGIRNPVGLAVDPKTGELWCSVNERDGLGDNLVPDYITHVEPGGFYGWPWWYMGGHQDPRHEGKHPELKDKVITPDVLLQPHNASLEMTFYDGRQFPAEYQGDIFAAEHGSWNKSVRVGYEVIRVPRHQTGRASGEYEDFLTGFVVDNGHVWGRPVGVTVAKDGSLLVTDDASGSIWRVSYTGT
jgi:glucose/arabinose dehydrogenase